MHCRQFTVINVLFICLSIAYRLYAADECEQALGMEEGRIPDHAISASSSYELKSVGPQNGRVRQEKNGGAWCPKAQISKEVREFLEIDLNSTYLITAAETQGRFGNGQGQEYAEAYLIEYWRPSINSWVTYKNSKGQNVLTGNVNTYLVVRQKLELPFVATKVRFIPFSEHPRTVCMRVELFGCLWNQHLLQYTIPKPSKIRDFDDNDLDDLSYDGIITDSMLINGLGQLIDGVYAKDNNYGNQWIGWSNSSLNGHPLEIMFELDGVVELNEVMIHVNNLVDIEIFYGMTKVDMRKNSPISHKVQKKFTGIVRIDLKKYCAKLVTMKFHFAREWILISEVFFNATPINLYNKEEVNEQLVTATVNAVPIATNIYTKMTSQVPNLIEINQERSRVYNRNQSKTFSTKQHHISSNQFLMGLIMGIILVLFGIVLCTMFLMVRSRRKKVSLLHKHTALIANHNNKGAVSIDLDELKRNLSLTPILSNGVATVKSYSGNNNNYNYCESQNEILEQRNCYLKQSSDTEEQDDETESDNSSVYHEPYKLLKKQQQLQQQDYGHLIRNKDSSSATLGNKKDDAKFPKSMYKLKSFSTSMKSFTESFYAATDIFKIERTEQNFTPGIFTSIKFTEDVGSVSKGATDSLLDFPRHRLKIIEKFGESNFGMVHLCEVEKMPELNGMATNHNKQFVIVKSLWRDSTDTYREKFLNEIRQLMISLNKNDHFVHILGVCTQDKPICAILEYSEFGELPKYFQLIRSNSHNDSVLLNYDSLVFISFQIASGMQYLESLNLVHRDLAARNCIIGRSFKVKISDHAIYSERFKYDYYVNESKSKIPIRWMSWENLLMGNESVKSDVWSYGVTLWEVFTYCSQKPFAEMTNEQVIENCNRIYQKQCTEVVLAKPCSLCTDDIYELMLKCWSRNCNERPSFSEIEKFFNAKNVNFLHFNH